MKYVPMQTGMWAVFAGSFRKNLEAVFDLDPKTAGVVTAAAKKQYRRILRDVNCSLCHLDYAMAEAGGATDFIREYTLASGGPYCDCGYHKKEKTR